MGKTSKASKSDSGTKERVLEDIGRYIENPDSLMVSHGMAANQLRSTDNMNISPSKLYEDGGHKLDVVRYLATKSAITKCPNTPEGMFVEIEKFLTFCGDNKVPPTIGGFAVWCGVTVQRFNQICRDTNKLELSEAASVCKEIIRNFLEISAMDSSLNPIVYFHQNKVYYGAVENQQVTIRTENNDSEISAQEYRDRVINLERDSDGVYVPTEDL